MDEGTAKLAAFLREVSNWTWEAFCLAEHDPQYTSNEALIFALVRACAMEKMDAIKLALNRLDGKLKTPVRIELPKVYYLYPYATSAPAVDKSVENSLPAGEVVVLPDDAPQPELATLSLRQTLAKMADHPRQVPEAVAEFATATQQWLKGHGPEPAEKPLVKSVIAAHLLAMAQRRDLTALYEVFDQVDGKLVETIQVLGEDIFITDYSLTAPEGAFRNKDGIFQLEAVQSQDMWAQKLGSKYGD